VYEAQPGALGSLTLMPEWHVVSLGLGVIGVAGLLWAPLLAALLLAIVAVAASAAQALVAGARAAAPEWRRRPARERLELLATTGLLHLLQPLARLCGRIRHGLTPWRMRGPALSRARPRRTWTVWSERWEAFDARMRRVEAHLADMELVAARGGDYDTWDLGVRGGLLAGARLRATVEEHGAGRQLLRFRVQPRLAGTALLCITVLAVAAVAAAAASASAAACALAAGAGVIAARAARDCLVAAGALHEATRRLADDGVAEREEASGPQPQQRAA
jgi:hypothetical protein